MPKSRTSDHRRPMLRAGVRPRPLRPGGAQTSVRDLRGKNQCLAELGRLHEHGVLNDEEFSTQKARILGMS